MKSGDEERRVYFSGFYTSTQEVVGTQWLARNRSDTALVYADHGATRILMPYSIIPEKPLSLMKHKRDLFRTTNIEDGSYVYLRYLNVVDQLMLERTEFPFTHWIISPFHEVLPALEGTSKIYSNGACEIYYKGK